MQQRGTEWLKGEGESRGSFGWFADLRYLGQNFELNMELKSDWLDEGSLAALIVSFHHRHKDQYGYDMRSQPVEVVNLRLTVTAKRRARVSGTLSKGSRVSGTLSKGFLTPYNRGDMKQALLERRKVWFPGTGYLATPVYDRDRLPADCRIAGPTIIEQMDATTVVPPKALVKGDRLGYLHMQLKEG